MAHSYIEAHENELEGFLSFARANPGNTTLLIDTYDVYKGTGKAVAAAKKLAGEGIKLQAVRLDSGDLFELSKEVRRILDQAGFPEIRIFASGNLDEYAIRDLLLKEAPIDGFGVGTKLDTSEDAPYLECAYKLMEYAGKPRFKRSRGKATIPGRKQVFRRFEGWTMVGDVIALEGDDVTGVPLLVPVMTRGRRRSARRDLKEIASQALNQMQALPSHFGNLETVPAYHVEFSNSLLEIRKKMHSEILD
jgi:nicotinate phosphoribosyltransferase